MYMIKGIWASKLIIYRERLAKLLPHCMWSSVVPCYNNSVSLALSTVLLLCGTQVTLLDTSIRAAVSLPKKVHQCIMVNYVIDPGLYSDHRYRGRGT